MLKRPKTIEKEAWVGPFLFKKTFFRLAVVVAQLAGRSLPTPEVRGSTPGVEQNLY